MRTVAGYDDLLTRHTSETLDPTTFAHHAGSEAVESGWVVAGVVTDPDERLLLIDESWADGWKAPAGTAKPEEDLETALVREVREETGVSITPTRPHAIDHREIVDEATGESATFSIVFFGAHASSTAVGEDLGVADERIRSARWFAKPPTPLHHPFTPTVYRRIRATPIDE